MAAGSSAPELATVIIGVFFAKDDIGVSTMAILIAPAPRFAAYVKCSRGTRLLKNITREQIIRF